MFMRCRDRYTDEKWIETPLALVMLRPGSAVTGGGLKQWVNGRVVRHQRVIEVEFREEEFPRNTLGKLLKRKLREPYWPAEGGVLQGKA